MGFVWVHADSFLRCVASPFHSFVTTLELVFTYLPGSGYRVGDVGTWSGR